MATFMDMARRGANAPTIATFILSLASVAAIALFIYLRIRTP